MMLIFDKKMPLGFRPGFAPAICLRHNFVYISTLDDWGDTSLHRNFQNIALDSHADFWENLLKALSTRHQKTKLTWMLKQILNMAAA